MRYSDMRKWGGEHETARRAAKPWQHLTRDYPASGALIAARERNAATADEAKRRRRAR